ncbi:hypothetical protein [Rhodoplanes sp. Z2-YC6860]|uniref:hypothetical protein n=1 Tax=Rhodoplanes sp. Z2-YC6860 TaxID=674703 RepID=UPI00082D6317|nr:hypothetical protein [Rhodoplanes sp. Z2-YC6860]
MRLGRGVREPQRQDDLHGGRPDYHIYAGEQMVGRIYKTMMAGNTEAWFWGVNGLTADLSIGPMYGHTETLEEARAKLRETFDRWLAWARSVSKDDLKYRDITTELWRMGERP